MNITSLINGIASYVAQLFLLLPAFLLLNVLGITRAQLVEYSSMYDTALKKKRGPKYKLSGLEQTLILILFLRFHLPDCLQAVLFCQPRKTIYLTKKKTLEFLFQRLKSRINMGTVEWRLANSIKILGDDFSFVTDGSEQAVTSSSNAILDTLFFSTKKNKHTINTVVLINIVTKRIIHISNSYPGCYNDLEIVKKEHSSWSSVLCKREFGIGDEGFNGSQTLDIPICTTSSASPEVAKKMNHYRIRVENVFADIKDWAACSQRLRFKLENKEEILATHHKIWTVVSVFVNEKYDR